MDRGRFAMHRFTMTNDALLNEGLAGALLIGGQWVTLEEIRHVNPATASAY